MDQISVIGGNKLEGQIYISGSKNAALPIMAATLLTKDTVVLSNIPNLADIIVDARPVSSLKPVSFLRSQSNPSLNMVDIMKWISAAGWIKSCFRFSTAHR